MRFRDDYWFLSNMFPCDVPLTVDGVTRTFASAEAAFQACKCPERADEFVGIDGFAAKRLGRRVPLRADWEETKMATMERVLRAKFAANPELMTRLRGVHGHIAEDNTWGDRYWGRCRGAGENHLGRLLMKLRDDGR